MSSENILLPFPFKTAKKTYINSDKIPEKKLASLI